MCGVAGVIRRGQDDPGLVSAMLGRIAHRGPDDHGLYSDDRVVIGMRRLEVIDPVGGHQPMSDPEGDIWIVMNGEIYNFRTLARELAGLGLGPRTSSDTEVALLAYKAWGPAFLDRLVGMFAICIWDRRSNRALLARDRLGKKPLYYRVAPDGRLLFASELKALLADRDFEPRLSPTACWSYANLGYVAGGESVFEGVHRLPPGCYLEIGVDGPRVQQYWTVPPATPEAGRARWRSQEEASEEVGSLLADAVKLRLVADVPVGAFLSGGLDSSLVVSLMRAAGKESIRTFSVGFPDDAALDESRFSTEVASLLGTDHTPLLIGQESLKQLPRLAWHLDEPLADQAALPTLLLSELAREQVTVVLTGEGADELFGGYERYALFSVLSRFERLGRFGGRVLKRLTSSSPRRNRLLDALEIGTRDLPRSYGAFVGPFGSLPMERVVGPALRDSLATQSPLQRWLENGGGGTVARLQRADLRTWLVDDLLVKVDRTSMAASLEARCPYLDHRLVELTMLIPDEWKTRGRETKRLLRSIAARHLPAAVLARPKHVFAAPIARWLRGALAETAWESLSPQSLADHSVFEPALGRQLLKRHQEGEDLSRPLWALLAFQWWFAYARGGPVPN